MGKKLIFICMLLSLTSCVYYNTFYNAKQKFKEAEKNQLNSTASPRRGQDEIRNRAAEPQQPSISINDKTVYKSAIDKANKVIVYHPDSKYVDDALWLIGKARYNMTEFVASDKRLRELVVNDPNSKYVDDAYFYLGMNQFWLKDYDLALEAFNQVLDLKKSPYVDDAAFMIAYMDFIRGNYSGAIGSFTDMLNEYSKSDSAATAQYFIAVSHDSLGDLSAALEAYKTIKKYGPSHELYFDAQYAYGSTALKADSIRMGMAIFEKLAKSERYFDRSSLIRLKLAEGMHLSGKTDEAIAEYLKVIEQFPKSNQSTEAYYRLGLIYQNDIYDLEKAKDYFNKSSQEKRDSPFRPLALASAAQISKLETYRTKLGRDTRHETESDSRSVDSLAVTDSLGSPDSIGIAEAEQSKPPSNMPAIPDSLGELGPAFRALLEGFNPSATDSLARLDRSVDSSFIGPMPESETGAQPGELEKVKESMALMTDTTAVAIDSATINEDVEIRFLLAELYHHDLNRPDSALQEYLLLAETYPESEYTPKALLASAFIYQERGDTAESEKLYKRIVEQFPSTGQALAAASMVDNVSIPSDQNVESFYLLAEEHYFTHNDQAAAISLLDFIEEAFPRSEFAAKSAFTRAWITDEMITVDGDSSSYFAFAAVVDKYPETPYAENAKIKMGLVKRERKTPRKAPDQIDEDELSPEQDSLIQAQADSLRQLAGTLPMAPAVKDSGEFVYPAELMDERIKKSGRVMFKIKLDLFGNITEHQMLGPSGSELIDSVAVEALLTTTFDMSSVEDLSLLNDFFRYDIKFEPPDNWEDRYRYDGLNDPYRDQGP
ncbi:MAG: tetratricopeptide repeat protein [candidate division Zixibacteria bacterium]|nr:tetratricopeptide repeat protein [candidate division Zixibacteria bacterium]